MSDQAAAPKAVRFADNVTQRGFTQVPNAILRDSSISAGARLTYGLLSSFAWQSDECWVGQEKLGKLVGVGDRQIRNYLGELEEAKLLEITRQGLRKPNLYTLFTSGQERNYSSGQERNCSSDEEDTGKEDTDKKPDRKRKRVNRKLVSKAELTLAAAVVSQFNNSAGTALSVDAHLTPIVGRIRERPDYTEAQHRKIIEAVFASDHWWTGPPTPKIIYGNAGIFEQSIELARAKQKQKRRVEDPNAERERVRREFAEAEDAD